MQFKNISPNNSDVITCNIGKEKIILRAKHHKGPFLWDNVFYSLNDTMYYLMNLEY